MRIDDQLEEMKGYLRERDWDGLEKQARKRCEKLSGKETARSIAAVDLENWTDDLEESLGAALDDAEADGNEGVVLDFDPEKSWLCSPMVLDEYEEEDESEDDYWVEVGKLLPDGPECSELAELAEMPWDEDDSARGINGYLIARTLACVGRCMEKLPQDDIAVCVTFSDLESIIRVRELGDNFGRDDDDMDEDEEDE